MKSKILLSVFLVLFSGNIFLSGEVDARTFKKVDALITQKKFSDAKLLLKNVKSGIEDSPLDILIKYYYAKITYNENDYYSSSFLINEVLDDPDLKIFPLEIQTDVRFLAGKVFYRIELYGKAQELFNMCLNADFPNKNEIYLYLSDIMLKKKINIDKIRSNFFKVSRKKLDTVNVALYDSLAEDILWEKIDTSKVAFGDPNVSDIQTDDGHLYIGLWNGGFCKYDYVKRKYEFYFGKVVSDNIRTIYKNNDYVYVGTMGGVTRLNRNDGGYYDIPELINTAITSIQEDKYNVYFGTLYSGVFVYNKKDGRFYIIGKDVIPNVAGLFSTNNTLYITSYSGGLYYCKSGQSDIKNILRVKNKYIPQSPITDIIRIKNKLWMTTFGKGVVSFDLMTGKVSVYPLFKGEADENYCLCINVYKNKIYCGTLGKGIYTLDLNAYKWEKFVIPDKFVIQDIKKIIFNNNIMFIGLLSEGIIKRDFIIEN